MFVGEFIGAYLADSSALLADSLDMFADATVYGIALFGVYRSHSIQLKAARLTGVLQLALALGTFAEVARRLIFGSDPDVPSMVIVTLAALAANVTSLWLLARHRTGGAHMKATWICTQTDVIANFGVIAAAVMVYLFQSALPDLVIATVIACGANRRHSNPSLKKLKRCFTPPLLTIWVLVSGVSSFTPQSIGCCGGERLTALR